MTDRERRATRAVYPGSFDPPTNGHLDVIVKGLRVVSDFESEMSAAMMNRSLSNVDTLFLMSDQKYSFVSSSLVKEVFFLGGDVAALVPEPVLRVMAEKRTSLQRR